MTSTDEVRHFLGGTTMPPELVAELLGAVPALWLTSAAPDVLARDLALCHPALGPSEVRASVCSHDEVWRLSVVAQDRPGLLADTATAVAAEGLSVSAASVVSWVDLGLALHSLSLGGLAPSLETLHHLTERIRVLGSEAGRAPQFEATGRAMVLRTGEAFGDWIVTVRAPDQPGLLAAACRWFADNGSNIRAASIASTGGWAQDVFVVSGSPDLEQLADRLSRPASGLLQRLGLGSRRRPGTFR